jgi:hypothetical protein
MMAMTTSNSTSVKPGCFRGMDDLRDDVRRKRARTVAC